MSEVLVSDASLTAIANAIRDKNGTALHYKPAQMAEAISEIETEKPEQSKSVTVTANGTQTVTPDSGKALSSVNVTVNVNSAQKYEWEQRPALVKNFIDNVTYNPSDYTTSQIESYAPEYIDETNTKPVGKTITTDAGTLIQGEYGKTVNTGSNTLYNAVPSNDTVFGIVDINGDVKQCGVLKPSGALRWINTAATMNVRDLGGWTCDGGTVKYGMLFRGGEPQAVDKDVMVNQCGVRHELQLRGTADAPQAYSLWNIGYTCSTNYVWYSLVDTASGTDAWKQILRCVFDNVEQGKPLYFHCAAGADRTGTVAVILEAMLGMSQSDIDKDYELTSFATGTLTSDHSRRRNEIEYSTLISSITALTAGATFRDKVINWVASLGFTSDEINAFRSNMIDGTPATITLSIGSCSVANALSNVSNSNTVSGVAKYQPYIAKLNPTSGYAISNISITMGGVDITNQVFSGTKTVLRRPVTNNLTNCITSNAKPGVTDGEAYVATLTATEGYTLDGGTITITMGGVDVSTFYENGKIAIPNVTGNIIITAVAVASAPAYTNALSLAVDTDGSPYNGGLGYKNGYRISSSGAEGALSGSIVTGFIPVSAGDLIRFSGEYVSGTLGSENTRFYSANKVAIDGAGLGFTPNTFSSSGATSTFVPFDYDTANQKLLSFTVPNNSSIVYMRTTMHGATGADAIITVNEEIE